VTGDLRRHVPQQEYTGMYRYQWLYLPVLYGLLSVLTRVQDVLETYVRRMSGPIRVNYYGPALLRLVAPKALWLGYRVLLPLLYFRVPAATFWPCFVVWEMATGFYLAWNFEVSHVADTVEWPVGAPHLPRSWAASQVATGVDYSHGSWAAAWWSGALNYQIEHHLFPGVSQYYYPAIAGIVKATAEEFRIPYRLEPSFWAAWTAHVRHLYTLGKDGKKAA
jgi:fatty acid desaturase